MNSAKDELQDKAFQIWDDNGRRGTLAICTGGGKTLIGVKASTEYKRVLIVVSTETLRDNRWPKEFRDWEYSDDHVDGECYASLHKINLTKYDLIIFDEAHHLTPFNSVNLYEYKGDILGLTATPPEDEEKQEIFNKYTPVVFIYTVDEGVRDGVVAPYGIKVVMYNLDGTTKNIEAGNKYKRFLVTEKQQYRYLTNRINKPAIADCVVYDISRKSIYVEKREYELRPAVSKFETDDYYLIFDIDTFGNTILKGYLAITYGEEDSYYGKITHLGETYKIHNNNLAADVPKTAYLNRMRFLYTLPSKLKIAKYILAKYIKNQRCLIFAGSIEDAKALCDHTFHTKTNDKDYYKLISGEINRLASVDKLREGQDLPNMDCAILTKVNSNPTNFIQTMGRVIRWREDHKGIIWLLCGRDTQEEVWVKSAIKELNPYNIEYVNFEDL